jgi:hypothetical protein
LTLNLDGFSSGYSDPSSSGDDSGGGGFGDSLKLKFTNEALWVDPDENEVQAPLITLNVVNRVQKWSGSGGPPLETITLKHGEPWPDIGALNTACPEDEWYTKFGKLVGPWAGEHVVLFADLDTMASYWWPSPTGNIGACRAIRTLIGQTQRKRALLQQPLIFPVVKLSHTFMPTQYGGRERPDLIVQKWVTFGGGQSAVPDRNSMQVIEEMTPAATPATTAPALQAVERPSLQEDLDDKIEF